MDSSRRCGTGMTICEKAIIILLRIVYSATHWYEGGRIKGIIIKCG
jgi:hypothetical protein